MTEPTVVELTAPRRRLRKKGSRFGPTLVFLVCGLAAPLVLYREDRIVMGDITINIDQRDEERSAVPSMSERLFAFMIRDARRIVPSQPPSDDDGMHIFDYVDVYAMDQESSKNEQLYYDADLIGNPPCHEYSIPCYRLKMLQVFDFVVNATNASHFFYMEADNDLCVPLRKVRDLALRHDRYFIGTGVGASGWIMSREFVLDFLQRYSDIDTKSSKPDQLGPDIVAMKLLQEENRWSVTRQYLVSHSTVTGLGGLTVKNKANKHLPRCLEPHRGPWGHKNGKDLFGWIILTIPSAAAKFIRALLAKM